ncbi:hypothetical protein [Mycolicibacterium brumae]|uniref:Uncharacterized protein n=1 Tax=Mycolicibacterium brumae TaxID=85968 RepID=A0A2G5PD44_9MYCO|nr:hypothetical protein [Mycolicibacterium brumae]MCV7191879.1 hypothetical protein [Mycolicibacterium brumae]PIB76247.1 hypothetical protein CQY22_005850 [Mycolicibacterium brumae]RWA15742.1 hypothetical protein MBRU_09325 [Mycolicibacterium brumae DSM 44177]UWW07185.1 hypothetical protein L2Z93_000179 [Mycolicibacterium brumae]
MTAPDSGIVGTASSLQDGGLATAVDLVTTMARSYTRGRGFDSDGKPNAEIAAVIVTAANRLAANSTGLISKRVDDVEYQFARTGFGWTLAEQIVLNRFRVRAQ